MTALLHFFEKRSASADLCRHSQAASIFSDACPSILTASGASQRCAATAVAMGDKFIKMICCTGGNKVDDAAAKTRYSERSGQGQIMK
jgi:hypothetical protein